MLHTFRYYMQLLNKPLPQWLRMHLYQLEFCQIVPLKQAKVFRNMFRLILRFHLMYQLFLLLYLNCRLNKFSNP